MEFLSKLVKGYAEMFILLLFFVEDTVPVLNLL